VSKQDNLLYFNYLRTISWTGKLYFRYFLYPVLDHHLRGKTLDVGCGLGYLFNIRRNSMGVDINPYCVDYCKKKGYAAYYFETAAYSFEDASFDSVLFNNVLEHIADPTEILTEINRILKPGGILVAGIPGIKGFKKDPDHKVYYDEESLAETISKYKFKLHYYFHTPFRWDYLNRNLNPYCLFGVFSKEP